MLRVPGKTDGNSNTGYGLHMDGAVGMHRSHRHRRSFAISGDFGFLRQEGVGGECHVLSRAFPMLESYASPSKREIPQFFVSEESKFTSACFGVPDAIIDLDEASGTNSHLASKLGRGTAAEESKGDQLTPMRVRVPIHSPSIEEDVHEDCEDMDEDVEDANTPSQLASRPFCPHLPLPRNTRDRYTPAQSRTNRQRQRHQRGAKEQHTSHPSSIHDISCSTSPCPVSVKLEAHVSHAEFRTRKMIQEAPP